MRVHAIQTGEVAMKSRQFAARSGPRPLRVLDVLADRKWTARLPITCFAIEHPEGLVMVDTGESGASADPSYAPGWHLHLQKCVRPYVSPEQEVGAQMRAVGLDPARARWVVMTHMHTDHAGGLGSFPDSEIVMCDREADMAFSRLGAVEGYLSRHYPDWLSPRRVAFEPDPWECFDYSFRLTSDGSVRLVPTPGHTKGHVSVVVEDGDRVVLIGGDAAYDEARLLEGSVDGVAQDARAHRRSTERLRELCRRRPVVVLLAHDPDTPRRLAESIPTVVP